MEPLKNYSSEKAEEVFKTFPYTIANDDAYNRYLAYKARYRRKHIIGKVSAVCTKIAAILFLPLAIYTLYNHFYGIPELINTELNSLVADLPEQQSANLEYTTYSGMQGKIVLPDSSEVWLNSCSILKIPSRFDSTGRYVELSGEAYFKVKSNKNWPMYIKTNDVVTKVLGTEFNLSAYNNDPTVQITLINGKVEIVKKDKSTISMSPHEQVTIFNDLSRKEIKRKDIHDFENDLAWRNGYLIFNNTPMHDVIKKMERWYGVKFGPTNRHILRYNFTGRFKGESVTRVLDLLSISSNIRYKIDDSTVTLYQN